jgi:type I restriction enzyme M protein
MCRMPLRVVSLDEIKAEDWTLNISRYVLPPLQEDIPPLPEAVAAFKDALNEVQEIRCRLTPRIDILANEFMNAKGGWLQ